MELKFNSINTFLSNYKLVLPSNKNYEVKMEIRYEKEKINFIPLKVYFIEKEDKIFKKKIHVANLNIKNIIETYLEDDLNKLRWIDYTKLLFRLNYLEIDIDSDLKLEDFKDVGLNLYIINNDYIKFKVDKNISIQPKINLWKYFNLMEPIQLKIIDEQQKSYSFDLDLYKFYELLISKGIFYIDCNIIDDYLKIIKY